MAKFEIAIPRILKWEGGYVNHPNDPGGPTNMGITDRLDGKVDGMVDVDGDGLPDVDIKNLSIDLAKEVYRERFWNKLYADYIESQLLAEIIFDGYVNCGANAIKMLQGILNLKVDGKFGPRTLQVLNLTDEPTVYRKYKQARIDYYNDLAERKPALKVFLKGWLNRIESFPEI